MRPQKLNLLQLSKVSTCLRAIFISPYILFFFIYFMHCATSMHATDLSLQVVLSKHLCRVGDTISCDIKLQNEGSTALSAVQVRVSKSDALEILRTDIIKGTFKKASGTWELSDIKATDQQVQLRILFVLGQTGPSAVTAEIVACSERDNDSTPSNGAVHEDDLSFGTLTVPMVICGNAPIDITAYALPGFTQYQWKKDDAILPNETKQSLRITSEGKYSYLVLDNMNQSAFSAPIIVERGPYPEVELGSDIKIIAGQEVFIRPEVNGGLGPYRFKWTNDLNWDMKRKLKKGETMQLRVKVTDKRGCFAFDDLDVAVQ
jgi:hypothetical protein